jgi:predicted DNA-binding transcriptional regulator AlpA
LWLQRIVRCGSLRVNLIRRIFMSASTSTSALVNIDFVSQQTLLSKATIRRYVRSGLLPKPLPFGKGGALRWSRKAIERWLEQKGGVK